MRRSFRQPVAKLLKLGDPRGTPEWLNYRELGIGHENIPDLIRMASDEELNFADSKSLEVWSPLHAWRALGQLRAEAAIEPLIQLFHELEDDEWAGQELPTVFGMIGKATLPLLRDYLADNSHGVFPRISSADSVKCVAENDPESQTECVDILSRQLELYEANDEMLNAFLVWFLADLKAYEALPTIESACAADRVDHLVAGNWEDIQIEFGLEEAREIPMSSPSLPGSDLHSKRKRTISGGKSGKTKSKPKPKPKAKTKRKTEKESRKKNRKRKRR